MARETQAPAFLPLMVTGAVVAIAWHPAGWTLTVLAGLGMGWVLWQGRLEARDPHAAEALARQDQRPVLGSARSGLANRRCLVCGEEVWTRQGTLTHEKQGPWPWEELREAILKREPTSLDGYLDAYVELTWTTDAHRVDRLARALDHDAGWVPDDLDKRVHQKVCHQLRSVGAYTHVLARLDPDDAEPGDGALALETLADQLAQHVPDGGFSVPLAGWVLEQEAAGLDQAPPTVVDRATDVGPATPKDVRARCPDRLVASRVLGEGATRDDGPWVRAAGDDDA